MTTPGGGFATIAPTFKVAMLGPSGVGKTSILVSMLDDAARALATLPVVLRPRDEQTKTKIQTRRDELHSGIIANSFDSAALAGDNKETYYRLELRVHDSDDVRVNIDFLDYPGAWLTAESDGATRLTSESEAVHRFIRDADMVLVPVDAALLMEARKIAERKAAVSMHKIAVVEDIVEDWAAERRRSNRPALLFIAPVRTETYLADNGGRRDRAQDLLAKVRRSYNGVLSRFGDNVPGGEALYCPVDTLGCVELTRMDWTEEPGGLGAHGRYMLRPGQDKISILGAADILVAICRAVTSYTGDVAGQEAQDEADRRHESIERERTAINDKRRAAELHAELTATRLRRFRSWLNGKAEEARREQAAHAARGAAHAADAAAHGARSAVYTDYAEQLGKAVADLADRRYQRARPIAARTGAR